MIVACLPLPSAPPTSSRETAPKSRRINRATEPKKTPEAPLADQHDWRILAERLTQVEPEFIYNAAFSAPTAEQEILATPATEAPTESSWKPGRDMPPHLARLCERKLLTPQQERDLFRRMNYAKFRLAALRQRIDPNKPSAKLRCEAERFASIALADRDRIVQANLRLVVSIAKKFSDVKNPFDELLSEGISTLMRAVEKFDYDRGFRFSTYATQAIRRTLCRMVNQAQRDRTRFVLTETAQLEESPADETEGMMTEQRWEELRGALGRMLNKLDPRERMIIRCRFGLDRTRQVRTLQSLAREFGVCKERVRQLEMRAMTKLRTMAEQTKLSRPDQA